jgi:hypothetical protein
MADDPRIHQQAEGSYIAQAAEGGTASVHVTHVHLENVRGEGPPPPTYQIPPLPEHFIPRPDERQQLEIRLTTGDVKQGVLLVTAIHGPPGIGKKTLVFSVAGAVISSFPDGVFLASLSSGPDILKLLTAWIREGLRDYDFLPTDVDRASIYLANRLRDRSCLLILTDVSDARDVRPFLVGGPRCHVVLTTNRLDVAEDVHAFVQELGPLTRAQSELLLAATSQRTFDDQEREKARLLANVLGDMPLALVLAGPRVARGHLTDLLVALQEEVARLELLEGPRRRRKGETQLLAALNVILSDLRSDDEEAWRSFVWLGVLANDAKVTAPAAATLWQMAAMEVAGDILELLWSNSLLMRLPVNGQSLSAYRVHPVLHYRARYLLTQEKPEGLGIKLREAHETVVNHYRSNTEQGLWHTLPDDGYIHAHLTWHMERAQLRDAVHALLSEETVNGRNAWYEACDCLGQTETYFADIARALRLADEACTRQLQQGQPITAISLKSRYLLIASSVSSLGSNIPPILLSTLVQKNVWTPEQALAYARRVPATHSVHRFFQRIPLLAHLAPHLSEHLQRELLQDVWATHDDSYLVAVLDALAPLLSQEMLEEALENCRQIESDYVYLTAVSSLAAHLQNDTKRSELLEEVRAAAENVTNEYTRSELLRKLNRSLPELMRGQVQRDILDISRPDNAARWISDFVIYLKELLNSPFYSQEYLPEVLQTRQLFYWGLIYSGRLYLDPSEDVRQMSHDQFKAWFFETPERDLHFHRGHRKFAFFLAVGALAPYFLNQLSRLLSEEQFHEWFTGRFQIQTDSTLAPLASDSMLLQCIDWLEPPIDSAILENAFRKAMEIGDNHIRLEALILLLSKLSGSRKSEAVAEAVQMAQRIELPSDRLQALVRMAPYLPTRVLEDAVHFAITIDQLGDERTRRVLYDTDTNKVHLEWAFHIDAPPGQLIREIQASRVGGIPQSSDKEHTESGAPSDARQPPNDVSVNEQHSEPSTSKIESLRANALEQLIPHLSPALIGEAIQSARTFQNPENRFRVFLAALAHLPDSVRSGLLSDATETARLIESETTRIHSMVALLPFLPEDQQCDNLELLETLQEPSERANILEMVAPHLPQRLLSKAVHLAQRINDSYWRDEALEALVAALVRENDPSDAYDCTMMIEDDLLKGQSLMQVASCLTNAKRMDVLYSALETANHIDPQLYRLRGDGPSECRSTVIARVAQCLPEPEKGELLQQAARGELEGNANPRALGTLSVILGESGYPLDALKIARSIPDDSLKWHTIGTLTRYLETKQLQEILEAAKSLADAGIRTLVLRAMGPYLTGPLLVTAQDVAEHLPGPEKIMVWGSMAESVPQTERTPLIQTSQSVLGSINEHQLWIRAATFLIPHLPDPQANDLLSEALQRVRKIWGFQDQAMSLAELSRFLHEGLLEEALNVARAIPDPQWQGWAIGLVALRFGELGASLRSLDTIESMPDDVERSRILSSVVYYFQNDTEALGRALELASTIGSATLGRQNEEKTSKGSSTWPVQWGAQAAALDGLAPYLPHQLHDRLLEFWQGILHDLVTRQRKDVLTHLSFSSVTTAIGGVEATVELARAIRDIGRWWP